MITPVSYMEVLSEKYPNIKCSAVGDGTDYEYLHVSPNQGSDPLPSKAQLDADVDYFTRVKVWRAIQTERDRRCAAGVKVGNNWFHSDQTSRIQQIALVLFGTNLPPIQWKTLNGAYVAMTPVLAQQIFAASATSDITIFGIAEYHKAQMMASASPTTYDFTVGWPPIYTGSLLL